MGQLSAEQLRGLADAWTDYATALGDYRDAHARELSPDQVVRLDGSIDDAAADGNAFAEESIAASFDDAVAAYRNVSSAIADAIARTRSLASDAAGWDRFARIATAALALATAASGPASGILSAAADLERAATAS